MVDIFDQAEKNVLAKQDIFEQAKQKVESEKVAVNGDVFDQLEWIQKQKQQQPDQRPQLSNMGFFEGYYRYLHEKPERAKGFKDWLTRVVPNSISRTAIGVMEFPYHAIKSFSDPLVGLAEDTIKAKETAYVNKRVGEIGKATWDIVDGMSRFFGEPIGLYGWEKLKDKWLADPAAAVLGVTPTVKGLKTSVEPTPFGQYSDGLIKRNMQKLYDKVDVQAPFIRSGAQETGVAVKNIPSIRASEQQRALQTAKELKGLKLTPEDGAEITLQASRSAHRNPNPSPAVKEGTNRIVKYYNDTFKRLKKDKVLQQPWPQNQIIRNQKNIDSINEQISATEKLIQKEFDFTKTKTTTKKTQKTKTISGKEDISETVETVGGAEQSKASKIWEDRTRDALKSRGFSEGEANIAIEKLRETGGDKTRIITKTVGGKTVKTIKVEKIVDRIIKKTSPTMKRIKSLNEKINSLKMEASELEGTNHQLNTLNPRYTHIPLNEWYRKIRETLGEESGQRVINSYYKGRFFKERKTVDVGDFIEWLRELKDEKGKPIFEPSDFDARMVMTSYSQKVGVMRGLAKVFNNANKDGLIVYKSGKPPNGYGEAPLETTIRFPELKNKYIHNSFLDYMGEYTKRVDRGMELGRIMGYTKIMAFYNPIFLPVYDLWQASWAGSLGPNVYKSGKYFYNGFKSALTKDKIYYDAVESGALSTPYTPPFESFKKEMQNTTYAPLAERALDVLGKRTKNPFKLVDDFYKVVWNMAWGGDGAIRIGTYRYLRDKGFSKLDSGQMTAYFHGDYARLAPGARKVLNKIWFTPTFKYVMGHLQMNMIKSSVAVLNDAFKLQKPQKRDLLLAKGLTMLVAGQMAKDKLMHMWGFKTDALGLRYKKDVDTDEGQKELVVYWPDPNNVLMRQVHKWSKWGDNPERLDSFMNKLHWDLHPLWSLGYELLKNTTGRDDRKFVYNPFDNDNKIAWDIIHHSVSKIVAAEGFVKNYIGTKDEQSAYKALRKEVGWINEKFLSAATFAYLRNPEFARRAYRVRGLKRLLNKFTREDMPKTGREANDRINNFFIRMDEIYKEE